MDNNSNEIVKYNNIEVVWRKELSGGGLSYGQQYIPVVEQLFGKVETICEFCAGPGFIGFSLLAHGLCNKLVLCDINPLAIEVIKETIKRNKLEDNVSFYLSNGLDDVPKTEKWDLIVSNPPHFSVDAGQGILSNDEDWKLHKHFYEQVHQFLTPTGIILFQENYLGSTENDFKPMLPKEHLQFINSFMYIPAINNMFNPYYYFWVSKVQKNFVWENQAILEIPVTLNKQQLIKIKTGVKFVFEFINASSKSIDITLLNSEGRNMSRLLPIATVLPGGKSKTTPLILTKGSFKIVNFAGDTTFADINVED